MLALHFSVRIAFIENLWSFIIQQVTWARTRQYILHQVFETIKIAMELPML